MSEFLSNLSSAEFLTSERALSVLRSLLIVVVGLALARLVSIATGKTVEGRIGRPRAIVAQRFTYYGLFALVMATAMHQVGFQLQVLLGAAGILTVAVGFASQTSASNLISGLFLVAERPFVIGDIITVDTTTGEVLSIDLLSVKLRTFDNLYVRIPNESLFKSSVTNFSHFPIRRADMIIGVAYKEDLARVEKVLRDVADLNPLCLDEPEPVLIFKGFGASSLDIQFSVWGAKENFLKMRNSMWFDVKDRFDREGIEIPFPHLSLYAGSVSTPIPVRLAGEPPTGDPPAAS